MDPRPAIIASRTRDIGRILAVTGGKGGIGKSSVSVGLALALADAGARVGLLDLDLWGPSCHVILGVPHPSFHEDGGLVPEPVAGLAFMSIASIAGERAVLLRGGDAGGAILELLAVTLWGELDVLVVDMPPGFADVLLDVSRYLGRAEHIIVTTPSALTAATTAKTVAVLERLHRVVLGTVVNMASPGDPVAGKGILGTIMRDPVYEAAIGHVDRLRASGFYAAISGVAAALPTSPGGTGAGR